MIRDKGPIIREIVFGLEDSFVSTLGAVTGIAIGSASSGVVLLAGLVYITVEALSMVAGSFIASKTQTEVEKFELESKIRKLSHEKPFKKLQEIESFLTRKGISPADKHTLLRVVSRNSSWFIEEIALHELGIPSTPRERPTINSIAMGASYLAGGFFPVIPYALFPLRSAIVLSICLTLFAITGLGILKAKIGNTSPVRSIFEVLLISVSVTMIGFLVGYFLNIFLHLSPVL